MSELLCVDAAQLQWHQDFAMLGDAGGLECGFKGRKEVVHVNERLLRGSVGGFGTARVRARADVRVRPAPGPA